MSSVRFTRAAAVRSGSGILVGVGVALLLGTAQAFAQPPTKTAVAKSDAPAGAISRRAGVGKFDPLPDKPRLSVEELLILLPGATITNLKGSVSLSSLADYEGKSPLP